jgi:carboxyl-terminal processing protease
MIKRYRWLWIGLPLGLVFFSFCFGKKKPGEDLLPKVVINTLANAHFEPKEVDAEFSEILFEEFLKKLDRSKRFFLKSDYVSFEGMKRELHKQMEAGTYEYLDLVSETFEERVSEVELEVEEILKKPFDFSVNETYFLDEDKKEYPVSKEERVEDWRKYLKYSTLEKYFSKIKQREKAVENKDTSFKILTDNEIEAQSREEVLKTNKTWFERLKKFDREKQLDLYINSMTEIFDPHTSYFPPKDKEDFDIRMSGRLEGIGAQLSQRDGEIKVEMIVPGSPSYLQGELKEGDIVLKVAQQDSLPVDISNMDLSDAVQLIRGKKGTAVTLTVKKKDGSMKDIRIVRDVVIMEEGYAKSAVIKEGKNNYGFIHLPQFYTDMNQRGGRTCSKDVAEEIKKLKNENIKGLILDLRYNGGGSLQDVIEMAGLFIAEGPIVQIKSRFANPEVLKDRDGKIQYDGPLVILVNKYSASASEILAAAMQDYNRALIIGTNEKTFGKGTVQRFFDLDRIAGQNKPTFGALKVTIQKFYRISGASTQKRGVTPDIIYPDRYSALESSEDKEDFSLAWDEIDPVPYKNTKVDFTKEIAKAKKVAEKRNAKNEAFKMIEQESKRIAEFRNRNIYQLNYEAYKAEQESWDSANKQYDEDIKTFQPKNNVVALQDDLKAIADDSVRLKIKNDWLKGYVKDLYLNEAVLSLGDL